MRVGLRNVRGVGAETGAVATAPRPVLPGKTYHVVSRCVGRTFRLVPVKSVNLILWYCFAVALSLTGVEIHPAARIGRRFFIDHGTGVVIGETAEIGSDCVLFHNVTLGGTGKHEGKRHPTLEDGVFVGTGATLLGPIHVGRGAKIGAGAFVHMRDVPADTTVVGMPARIVKRSGHRVDEELPRAQTEESALLEMTDRPRAGSAGGE